jgi:hypothetical protein
MKFKQNRQALLSRVGFALLPVALACALGFSASTPAFFSLSLPAGTVLPVKIEKTLSAADARAGQVIDTEIMQEVPLPDRQKLHAKSHVRGTIVSVVPAAKGSPAQVSLRFDKIEYSGQTIPVATSLRAIASYQAVESAIEPLTDATGTPSGWANTVLIGGDTRYGDGGEVLNRWRQKVGEGVSGGVLLHIRSNPTSGCDGPVDGDDSPQALWLFSADACGVYDIRGLKISHDGSADPVGVITLSFEESKTKVVGASAMLLRVVAPQ